MFTGIITDIGRVRRIVPGVDTRLEIETAYDPDSIALGASIACSGVCLTVIEKGRDGEAWFAVQASQETLARTTLGSWCAGHRINLERALRAGDELGGHLVSGHVDGVGEIVSRAAVGGNDGGSTEFVFRAPSPLLQFIAAKGSIALDGVSLTVNRVEEDRFSVNLIPHSLHETTFGQARVGDPVNIEIDMLARYVARILGKA